MKDNEELEKLVEWMQRDSKYAIVATRMRFKAKLHGILAPPETIFITTNSNIGEIVVIFPARFAELEMDDVIEQLQASVPSAYRVVPKFRRRERIELGLIPGLSIVSVLLGAAEAIWGKLLPHEHAYLENHPDGPVQLILPKRLDRVFDEDPIPVFRDLLPRLYGEWRLNIEVVFE